MAPPVEEAPTKVVKVATTVARRPSAMTPPSDETALATPTSATEEDLHLTALEESLHSAKTSSYEARCVCVCACVRACLCVSLYF